ncbi:hypothetical protein DEU56DRAFT_909098 [Suillus clintonianus]|uniref:uncharacterized protein n=1 Tax=Suillus clintonianus TaxID=1904413 RepID=UPI001B87741C|nr:uncharacterized protein DEU56DRAFT_909098 [Suillus clintonianus]KAG2148785.1 hypothetical protein DEU56DRAFT_909098 [Suillus clintonianus]
MDAFSCSVRRGSFSAAVELVEQGRAAFWTQLARFPTPLDELSALGDTDMALAVEFKQLSFRLRHASDESTEDKSPQIRQLTVQWDDVVSRIRLLPVFRRFLLPLLFSDLQKAAEDGPVVILNSSKYSCDALIITSAQDPIHIPLDITQTELSELSSDFQELRSVSVLLIMKELIQPGSRIWWCPTAEFDVLPLHAAGPYEKKIRNVSQFYISSYTPSLATLIRARQQLSRDSSTQQSRLAFVVSFTWLEDSDATVHGAFNALNHNKWLHLACHGMPNRKKPFESSFAMRNRPLTIREIIRSHWQNPEFTFLSACLTIVGDEFSLDEAIYLAAAMQFSGFRSVIGSM